MTDIQIPGYEIERELGRGGMATVYLAVQQSLDRPVALKVMKAALAADDEFAERFVREARTAARLQHPGIVSIFDAGVSGHHSYIAMEYIAGEDLKSRMRQAALTASEAAAVVAQIARALAYAHGEGFVHRDVKPENILFRKDGSAVLSDFGIARAIGSGTRMTATGLSIGTPHYMSPEQARGKEVDGRSDLYALGVLFYEMLTGEVPFEAQDSFAVGLMHINDAPPPLPAELADFQLVIDKLLAKDPAERYQSGNELSADLDRLEQGAPTRPTPRATRAAKRVLASGSEQSPAPSSAWQWALGGGALALVLAVGIYLWQDASRPTSPAGGGGTTVSRPASPTSPTSEPPATATETRDPKPVLSGSAILHIETNPEGAEVFLDDNPIGTTPFQSEDLPSGEYRLRLAHRYYEPWAQTVRLEDDVVERIEADLQRGQGRVTVITDPPGAEVWIDGSAKEGVTPVTLSGLSSGDQPLEIRLDRYRTVMRTVEILPGGTARLDLTLEGGKLHEWSGRWYSKNDLIGVLMEAASEDVKAERLTAPADSSAIDKYRRILELQADYDPARQAIEEVGRRVVELAKEAFERGDPSESLDHLLQAEEFGVADQTIEGAADELLEWYAEFWIKEAIDKNLKRLRETRDLQGLSQVGDRRLVSDLGDLFSLDHAPAYDLSLLKKVTVLNEWPSPIAPNNAQCQEDPQDLIAFDDAFNAHIVFDGSHLMVLWDIQLGYSLYVEKVSVNILNEELEAVHVENSPTQSRANEFFDESKVFRGWGWMKFRLKGRDDISTLDVEVRAQGVSDKGVVYPPTNRLHYVSTTAARGELHSHEAVASNANCLSLVDLNGDIAGVEDFEFISPFVLGKSRFVLVRKDDIVHRIRVGDFLPETCTLLVGASDNSFSLLSVDVWSDRLVSRPSFLIAEPSGSRVQTGTRDNGHSVQVAVFRSKGHAEQLSDELCALDFPAYYFPDAETWRVQVGPASNLDEAERLKAEIEQQVGLAGIIIGPHR